MLVTLSSFCISIYISICTICVDRCTQSIEHDEAGETHFNGSWLSFLDEQSVNPANRVFVEYCPTYT